MVIFTDVDAEVDGFEMLEDIEEKRDLATLWLQFSGNSYAKGDGKWCCDFAAHAVFFFFVVVVEEISRTSAKLMTSSIARLHKGIGRNL